MSELLQITEEQRKKLDAPLPPEALKQHPIKNYLTTINSAFMIERLNEVFGAGTWTVDAEVLEHDSKMVVVKTKLHIPAYDIVLHSFGGNDNVDKGDAYKGAMTDGFTKCCSYLGIGLGVWKNEKQVTHKSTPAPSQDYDPQDWGNPEPRRMPGESYEQNLPPVVDKTVCPACDRHNVKYIPAGISKKTNKPFKPFFACQEEGCKKIFY